MTKPTETSLQDTVLSLVRVDNTYKRIILALYAGFRLHYIHMYNVTYTKVRWFHDTYVTLFKSKGKYNIIHKLLQGVSLT